MWLAFLDLGVVADDANDKLHVQVWDADVASRDDKLCEMTIPLSDLTEQEKVFRFDGKDPARITLRR